MPDRGYDRLAGVAAILSPTNPLVAGIAGLTGFVHSPLFYVALGLWLRRGATD